MNIRNKLEEVRKMVLCMSIYNCELFCLFKQIEEPIVYPWVQIFLVETTVTISEILKNQAKMSSYAILCYKTYLIYLFNKFRSTSNIPYIYHNNANII